MQDKYEFLNDLLKSCALPELKADLDNLPIDSEHFNEYRQALAHQLPTLYNFIQQNEQWIWDSKERENQEVNAALLILLCEITAPGTIYAFQDKYLLQNADRLLQQHLKQLSSDIESKLFVYYQNKLRSDCWKRQIGAVHGFMRFLELCYVELSHPMSLEWLKFSLSVGLNFRECYEPAYKHLSAKIFQLMLQKANRSDIVKFNIHSVIYDAMFKNVYLMDTVPETADTWNCLSNCLDFFEDIDSFSWNKTDDMMEILLRHITLAPNAIVSICLLKFVTRLCFYFSINCTEIESKISGNFKEFKTLTDCRSLCVANTSCTPLRWAKNILQIFISETHKLMAGTNICKQLLQEIHRCYMVCILPIPLQVAKPHLIPFWNKFMACLMEAIVIQQKEKEVVILVKMFLETILWQLMTSSYWTKDREMLTFHYSLEQILKQNIFSAVN